VTNLPKDGGVINSKRLDSNPPLCTRSFIALVATWKIASKSNKWISLPIARASAIGGLASNQLRLWFSVFAHLIMSILQAEVLKGTELESASIGRIRLRLFKIAARLKASVRRIHIELCSAYPLQALFGWVHQRIAAMSTPA
jgi:hypothetical protein